MGRVSKHKKIKSCDPFYRGPRKNPVRKGDLPPPNDDDQPVPKSFLRLLKYSDQVNSNKKNPSPKQQQQQQTKSGFQSTKAKSGKRIPTATDSRKHLVPESVGSCIRDKKEATHDAGSAEAIPLPEGRSAMFVRRPGESTRTYLERIDMESEIRIAECFKKDKKKGDRRKRYLEERKKKFKSRKRKKLEARDFGNLKDEVKFGEVVKAPPRLSAKPRGSDKKTKQTPKLELVTASSSPLEHLTAGGKYSQPVQVVGLKHKRDIEEERTRAISEYRFTKKAKLKAKLTIKLKLT